MAIQPVILAGGSGTRLWPLSRDLYPKQVIPLLGERSLLQECLRRALATPGARPPLLVVGENHRFMIQDQAQCAGMEDSCHILLEPVGRDTAAAVCGAACFHEAHGDPDDVLLVLPSDHLIHDLPAFLAAVAEAERRARKGFLVTFGLKPTRPETGYGYIEAAQGDPEGRVARFVEKPDAATAADVAVGFCA